MSELPPSALQPPGRPPTVAQTLRLRAQTYELSPEEKSRYSRHLLLPEVGLDGQLRLKAARVLIVGMGGLGAPASVYLAAAGVGTMGLADFDQIDRSNLQRQILYTEADIGKDKVATSAARLSLLNSAIRIVPHSGRLDGGNVRDTASAYDLVLDGTDNFATRYLLNDTCVQLGIPYVYGSILRFAGQASVFYPPHGPCYRCLFPEAPAPGQVPSCAEGGVLGVLPGQIGAIQATETIKVLLGIGSSLLGRLLTLDALTMKTSEFRLPRDSACPACGEHARLDQLLAAAAHSAATAACLATDAEAQDLTSQDGSSAEISLADFYALRMSGQPYTLIDVRSPAEYAICQIAGSRLIPLDELGQNLATLPSDQPLIVHCKAGPRSEQAVAHMRSQGFKEARSLRGGILAWARVYEPGLAQY